MSVAGEELQTCACPLNQRASQPPSQFDARFIGGVRVVRWR